MSGVSRVITTPRRQLTSVVFRQVLKAFVLPAVVKSYNIVAIRAVWHTNDDDRQLTQTQISQGGGEGGTSLCRVYGYVPPTRVDFSLPKIQNRPQILRFYSRTGPTFLSFTPEQDPFFTIWSQMPGSNVKIPVAFSFCFRQPDVFTFVPLYFSKCFKLSITGISLSWDICIPL